MLEVFSIPAGEKTPAVVFDFIKGEASISGVSMPENAAVFYDQILDRVDDFLKSKSSSVHVRVQLDFFSSVSNKCLYMIFKRFKELVDPKIPVHVTWVADEDDEDVEDFVDLLVTHMGLKVNLVIE